MELLSPWSLAWLGLLAPLVLLYVLRRRRTERVVASTLLWEAALRDLRAERPWQRLRPHLSLLLQALALVVGALALARPAGLGQVPAGAQLAVVIDVSASMGTEGPRGTRLARARRVARSLARGLPEGGAMTIVAAGAQPEVRLALTADRARLERALEELTLGGPGADLEGAVALAAERLRGAAPGSRIRVLTDAAFDGALALEADVPVEVERVGEPQVNHAVVALDVRARPRPASRRGSSRGPQPGSSPDAAEVFVRVARYGPGEGDARVSVAVGDEVLAARRLRLADGAPRGVVLPVELAPDTAARAPVVEARIEALEDPDPFGLDDLAVAPSPAARRLPVFLVGDAPASVERVLRADPEVELYRTDLAGLAARGDGALDGLHVFAGEVPAEPPPGDAVVVAPEGDAVFGAPLGAPRESPRVVSWDEADERLRFVHPTDVHLARVRPIEGGARPLLTTDRGVALAALSRPGGETTILAFDPDEGDWASQPGFVVLFRNLLERARRRRAEGGVPAGPLGAPLLVPARDGQTARVTGPSGRRLSARARGGVAVVPVGTAPGVYEVAVGERRLRALRSLTDPAESDLRPRASFTRRDEAGATRAGATRAAAPVEHREAWPWLAGALLLLLTLEVLYATRRGAAA